MTRAPLAALLCLQALFAGPAPAQASGSGSAATPRTRTTVLPPRPLPFPYAWKRAAPAELRGRREKLAASIGRGVVIVLSRAPASSLANYRYVPDEDFYYLTGVDTDPGALVMSVADGRIAQETLFLPTESPFDSLWNGWRLTAGDDAGKAAGIADVQALRPRRGGTSWKSVEERLEALLAAGAGTFWMALSGRRTPSAPGHLVLESSGREECVKDFLTLKAGERDIDFRRLEGPLGALRSVKSPHEIALVREAVAITGAALRNAMGNACPGMWEFEVMGIIEGTFVSRGASGNAFASICGAGVNACTLHYVTNRDPIRDGDLVLCDVGAAAGYYAADVTRTFPVSGTFTPRQREVYETVLRAQAAGEAVLRPGATLNRVHDEAARVIRSSDFRKAIFPHFVGHHVGLNVHDPGGFRMQPGMIVTIEPGIYLRDEGIGVRIEDDYLVTEDGFERLSSGIPRTVEEIEALVGSAGR